MKAAVYRDPETLTYEEIPKPSAGRNEVVVRLASVGVCGTDLHKIVHRLVPAGSVLGHEVAGTIAEAGAGVTGFRVGDPVYSGHHVPCFTCEHCTRGHHSLCAQFWATNFEPGGFAEYFRLSELHVRNNLRRIPEGVSFDEAAMVEPVATVVHAMKRVTLLPGDTALVMGAGPIGDIWVQVLRFLGAGKVIVSDVAEARLRKAKEVGASSTVNVAREPLRERLKDLTQGHGPHLVVVAAGVSSLLKDAVDVVAPGGQVVAFSPLGDAQPIDASRFFTAELNIVGAYSSVPTEYGVAMALIAQGIVKVKPLISHHLPLSALASAVRLATDPSADVLKIMLHPTGE